MANIDRVIIFSSPNDVSLTELCVASIRFWNKDIPLYLHKDESRKLFNTQKIQDHFDVKLCDSSNSSVGNPMSKFYYVTQGADIVDGESILILDSDTAWFGNVADLFESIPDEIQLIVQGEMNPSREWLKRKYFDSVFFQSKYPEYNLPNFVFNSGHFVIKVGSFNFSESDGLLNDEKSDTIAPIFPYDQGLFNFIHAKRKAEGTIQSSAIDFAKWSGHNLNFDNIQDAPFLIHWAGQTHPLEERMAYWVQLKKYRVFFLKTTASLPFRLFYPLTRAFALLFFYLKQFRLVLLGKKKFLRS